MCVFSLLTESILEIPKGKKQTITSWLFFRIHKRGFIRASDFPFDFYNKTKQKCFFSFFVDQSGSFLTSNRRQIISQGIIYSFIHPVMIHWRHIHLFCDESFDIIAPQDGLLKNGLFFYTVKQITISFLRSFNAF